MDHPFKASSVRHWEERANLLPVLAIPRHEVNKSRDVSSAQLAVNVGVDNFGNNDRKSYDLGFFSALKIFFYMHSKIKARYISVKE